jgi:type IV pilus assembly protein PilE
MSRQEARGKWPGLDNPAMVTDNPHHPARAAHRGFTLIEVMIAMVVVAILVAIALPNFNSSQRKSRRSDAMGALTSWQQAEERLRSNSPRYATSATDLSVSATSPLRFYGIAATVDSASEGTSYILAATAQAGTSQADDAGCQILAVKVDGGNVSYGSAASGTIDWTDANKCWAK